ncbi:MAG: tyrosine--tRNA ligase [Anaerolineaceae bacterium]|nr:tyrosine--tRNA ligase [Anaerolineaceae bacterium]
MNLEQQVEFLMQGADYGDDEVYQTMRRELTERLAESAKTGKPLKVYCGYDPNSSDLHLGHTISMRKLKAFQDLGHDVTFLIGTFTARIGDPDKDKARAVQSNEAVRTNAETYAKQAFRVLDPAKTTIVYNADWLADVTFEEIFKVASNFTVQQFLARDNFHKRINDGTPIYLHEFFYALMQGFDAHHLDCDVQLGGTDQLFNLMAARKLMQSYGQKPNIAMTFPLLPGTDGELKMSKSLGNYIPINTTASDMYGKVMSIPDKVMPLYASLTADWMPDELKAFKKGLEDGSIHPRDAKMRLAKRITELFYGEVEAQEAQNQFVETFQKKNQPDEMPEYKAAAEETVSDIMLANQLAKSKGEIKRLLQQNGIKLNGQTLQTETQVPAAGDVLQVGKRHFIKILK